MPPSDSAVLTSPLLRELDWLEHGFGTRQGPANQNGMASLKQIHSARVLMAGATGCVGEGDALVTAEAGVTISIRTADCYPVLLVDTKGRAVSAIHAGWRGSASRIVPTALEELNRRYGTQPDDIIAAIGPGIGSCCYEVGDEVARQFGQEGQIHLDLAAENLRQLRAAGVPRDRIDVLGHCTACQPANFFSWRRDRDPSARMISFIGLRRL